MDVSELLKRLENDGIEHLWVIYHDYSGRSCAKTVPRERFASTAERGVVFARANLDFTLDDHQAPGAAFLADTGDFLAVPDPDSYAAIPYRQATARAHVFMRADADGNTWEGCPRTQLQRILEAYAAEGLSVQAGFEAEFTLFTRTVDGEYAHSDQDGMFTLAGLDRHADLWHSIVKTLGAMDVAVMQHGKEYGPGQNEMTTGHAPAIKAADDYLTLKEVVRALARQAGWIATFMPKPYAEWAGNGLHLHLSLWDLEGKKDLSMGESDDEPLSPLGRPFTGGLLAHAAALAGIGAPTVNSYKRLLPGSWAPAHVCWGVGNRATLVRVPAMGRRRHIEFRSGDNAINPFNYLTAVLAAGLDGIHRQIEPPAPIDYDVGHLSDEEAEARGIPRLPGDLSEALAVFEADEVIAQALGEIIFPEFLKVKRA
ncbi:MAG TPA: glutamine synthetase family protein, partial [Xanthomonadales bacterium]|nr:glutamine synthetase family protein [Xanthomonadales bacterium]